MHCTRRYTASACRRGSINPCAGERWQPPAFSLNICHHTGFLSFSGMRWTDIQVFLGAGMIVPSTSSFSHPIVCVTKKDSSIRLCVDYNYLNSGTVPDYYPMPNMDEFIYEMGHAEVISTLELTKGYWQVPVDRHSQSKTAFITHNGCYEWTDAGWPKETLAQPFNE